MTPEEPFPRTDYLQDRWSNLDVKEFSQTLEDIDGRGDLAYVRGSYRIVAAPKDTGQESRDEEKYVAIVRKQSDGSWLTEVGIWNSDLPLPEQSAESEM